jgi:LAO/AO transport system kinase
MIRSTDPATLVARARSGDRLALGRLLTAVESRAESLPALTRELMAHAGGAHVVGITGAPGVGKSTTTSALIGHWRSQGKRVGVLAVDPSSPFTGGALLGDRVRMEADALDEGVFIRSMAARGQLGGLAAATPAAVRALDACGFDKVIVETVGVGQSEIDIVRCADTVVILLAPGMGDGIQAVKAGLLEVGDTFAVNKSDRDGARKTLREIRSMVAMKPLIADRWRPQVLPIVATRGTGIAELADVIDSHLADGSDSGALAERQRSRLRAEISGLATEQWSRSLASCVDVVEGLVDQVHSGVTDPYAAAAELIRECRP